MPNDFNFDMSVVDFGGGADIDGFLSTPTNQDGGMYTGGGILQSILPKTAALQEFELGGVNGIQTQGAPGLDALFAQEPTLVTASSRRRMVASCADLKNFTRVSAETLIHKSDNDLWALKKEGNKFWIERLFDDNGSPLKG